MILSGGVSSSTSVSTVRCAIVFLVAIGPLSVGTLPAVAQAPAKLVAFPADVHSNDTVYVAGGTFPAGENLQVFLFCLDPWHSYYGHWKWAVPREKVSTGTFVGWEFQTPTPFTRDKVQCTLTARDGDNPFGATSKLTIWQSDQKIPPAQLALQIRARAVRSASRTEVLDLSGQPGARVALTVRYPRSNRSVKLQSTIPWTGLATVTLRLPVSVSRGQRVVVTAQGRLGSFYSRLRRIYFAVLL